jgi:phosphoglycerate dehydrogenase-like enzyme
MSAPRAGRIPVLLGLYHHVPVWNLPRGVAASLAERFPGCEFREVENEAALARELPWAEVYFGWWLPEPLLGGATRLRWVHTPVVGIRRFLSPSFVESGVFFTNGRGINAVAMAEHVMGALLARTRGIVDAAHVLSGRRWDAAAVEREARGLRELEGATLLVVGWGAVGRETAKRALAFGMRVTAIRRGRGASAAPTAPRGAAPRGAAGAPGVLDEPDVPDVRVRGREDLHDALGEAEYVVLALPHTDETENLFDEAAFRRMRKTAYLVNVGRGAVVVEAALVRALEEGWIDGASLDVVAKEPLDPASPLHGAPRLSLTPHISGLTPRYWERAVGQFEENLRRWERGEPLRNVVDKRAGY